MAKADSRHGARRWILENLAPGDPIAIELYGPVLNSGRIERLAITWPFYSSQAASVGIAYHPEFLEGIRYYALSGEVRRRFEAEAERYPNEVAHYRWLDGNAVTVWGSRAERFGGPEIRILSLPPGIRPRAIRDSIWAGNSLVGADSSRLTRWCGDLATLGAATGRLDLAEEWATRGAGLAEGSIRLRLLGMAGEAILRQGRFEHAVRFLERVREDYPTTLEIRILLGLALTESSRPWEALAEYRTALSLAPDSAQRTAIQFQMEKLSSLRKPSDSR
jgi:tetratricopeptide (TPR) repeat protein